MSPTIVQQVQASLRQQHFYGGAVDGISGPVTQSAVRRYQQAHGLVANGHVDSATLASLNSVTDGVPPVSGGPPQQSAAPLRVSADTHAVN
jgi:peptidoglycan hydrolase-like protein with peptidoglycan-binding domain